MAERTRQIKYLVEELSQPPWKYTYNVAAFGSMTGTNAWNILQAVLSEIDPNYKQERYGYYSCDRECDKVMEVLRVLRYWPKHNDQEIVQDGLEKLIPEVIWNILEWLLQRKDQLKQRAYLAQFLVKINIPDEIMLDDEVNQCYSEYEQKIDEFKESHKKLENMNQEIESGVAELVRDLERIDYDIECLSRKVDGVKSKVKNTSDKDEYLEQAKFLRNARETKLKLEKQMQDEEMKLLSTKRRVETMYHRLSELADLNKHNTPESAIERMEQDSEILRIIVEQRLPHKIEEVGRTLLALSITEERPPECRADLEYTRQKIDEVSKEIAFYESKAREKEQDPSLNFARCQASNNIKKKLDLAEELELMKGDLVSTREVIEEKRQQKRLQYNCEDDFLLTTEGYREYVKDMRRKAGKYKMIRGELHSLQAEVGHLSTTKFILDGELKDSEDDLKFVENQLGIVGFTSTQDKLESLSSEKSVVEKKKMESIYQMATLAKQLNDQVQQRKSELEPLVSEVQKERKVLQEIEVKVRLAKFEMEEEMNPINDKISKLEKAVDQLRENYEMDEHEFIKMEAEIPVLKSDLARAYDIAEVTSQPGPRVRTYREKLLSKIVENERTHNFLENEKSMYWKAVEYEKNQKKMWMDLINTLQVKMEIHQAQINETDSNSDGGANSLLI